MPSLEELQHDFQNYILQDDHAVLSAVAEVPPLCVEDRLDLYAEAYHLRLFDVLKADYAVLFELMGEDHFIDLFRDYVDALPSHYRSIRWFGKHQTK